MVDGRKNVVPHDDLCGLIMLTCCSLHTHAHAHLDTHTPVYQLQRVSVNMLSELMAICVAICVLKIGAYC
jgi:hypothetical protein